MKRAFAAILSSLLVVMPAFADRTVYAPVRLAPTATAGKILFADGTAAAPSMSFSADVDTGVYRPGADSVGIVTNGTERLRVASQISGPNGSAAGPAFTFLSDQDNGMYRVGSDIIGFATAGVGKLTIESSGNVIVGQGHNGGTPVAGSILGAAGSGTNIAGANLTIAGGNSSGSGAGGALIFQTAAAGSSGTTANTLTERMRITSDGEVGIGSSTATGNRLALTYTTASGVAKIGPNSTGGNTSLALGTSASGTYADRMTITSAGEVGIGKTPASGYMLDVSHATDARIGLYNGSTRIGILQTTSSGFSISGVSTYPINLATNGSDRMRVKSNGQVRYIPLAADPAGAEEGDVYFNSVSKKLKVYDGTNWVDLH